MYGLAVNRTISLSGHLSNIDEMALLNPYLATISNSLTL